MAVVRVKPAQLGARPEALGQCDDTTVVDLFLVFYTLGIFWQWVYMASVSSFACLMHCMRHDKFSSRASASALAWSRRGVDHLFFFLLHARIHTAAALLLSYHLLMAYLHLLSTAGLRPRHVRHAK